MARATCRWAKEFLWIDAHHGILDIWRCGAPQRDTAVAAVVLVKIAKRKLGANEEARRAMAHALADLRQSESDLPHRNKFALLRLLHPRGQHATNVRNLLKPATQPAALRA